MTGVQTCALPIFHSWAYKLGKLKISKTSGSDEEKDKAAKWIQKHCADHGFILRYPPNKESIKDRKGNPFYIRFVGKDYASKLMKEDMTLEDFYGEAY